MATTLEKVYAAWETEGNKDLGHRKHLGASVLGDPCERKLWYVFRWGSDITFNGRMLRLFNRGQLEEQRFCDELRKAGVIVDDVAQDGNQWRFTACNGHVGGSMDAHLFGLHEHPTVHCVGEFKTHNDKSFAALTQNGVKESKPLHYSQMQLYMHWSGMRKAFYMAVNKNNDELYTEFVDYNESHAEELMNKADRIIASDRAPGRLTEDSTYYLCKWCDHRDTCHAGMPAAVNCRTCLHSSPVAGAKWECARHKKEVDDAQQRKACNQHLFIPGLLPFGEVINASPDENWVEYRKADGGTFRNGPDYWPSTELQYLPKELTDDVKLQQLRQEFDGRVVA